MRYPENYFFNKKSESFVESSNKSFYFPYQVLTCSELEDNKKYSNKIFLNDGLINIIERHFFKNDLKLNEFITSEKIYDKLPIELKDNFSFYNFESVQKKPEVKDVYYISFYDGFGDSTSLKKNLRDNSFIYLKINNTNLPNNLLTLSKTLNIILDLSNVKFIDDNFFKSNLTYDEYQVTYYFDEFIESFSIDLLEYINLGLNFESTNRGSSVMLSSHAISPVCNLNIYQKSVRGLNYTELGISRKLYEQLNFFNKYYYLKKSLE